MYSIQMVNGYITVRVSGTALPGHERIALETKFAQAMADAAGGNERLRQLCLTVANQGAANTGDAAEAVAMARSTAEASVKASTKLPAGVQFVVEAWTARDL